MIKQKVGNCDGKGVYISCGAENVPIVSSRHQCNFCSVKYKYSKKVIKKPQMLSKSAPKKVKIDRIYLITARQFKKDHPECYAQIDNVCSNYTVDIHHTNGRGINLLNTSTWLGVCRLCHTWIHEHPKESREKGLLV